MTRKNQKERRLKVLITAPSLDELENVSGISTLVRGIVRNCDCDFVHFKAGRRDFEKAGILWVIRQILLPLRFLIVILKQRPDVVHINTAFVPLSIYRDAALTFCAALFKYPVLLHPNGGRFLFSSIDSRLLALVTNLMVGRASRVLVLSEIERESLARRWPGLEIDILPNAIATDHVIERKQSGPVRTIIFLGRIHESKGLEEILGACRLLKDEGMEFRFVCYGAGPRKDTFVREMAEILGESFSYQGVIAGAAIWKALAESDIFLLPSRYGEGLPLSMLEAMAAGCVVVVGDVASVRTVIQDGKNGFIVAPYEVSEVVGKLRSLLSEETDWETLRDNARRTVETKYGIADYVVRLSAIYREID